MMRKILTSRFANVLAITIITSLTACGSSDSDDDSNRTPAGKTLLESSVARYEIRPYKEPCQREPRDFCLVGDDGSGIAQRMYSDIEGLPFRWGWIQTAEIQADRIEDTPGGQQRYEYKLLQLISETRMPAGSQFEINVDVNDITVSDSCEFQLLDESGFRAPDPVICTKLNSGLQGGLPLRAVFAFTSDDKSPIELVDVKSPIIPAQ